MKLETTIYGKTAVVTLMESRLDAARVVQFKDAMRDLAEGDINHVILDMAKVSFMDSSGLGAMVAVKKMLGEDRAFEISTLTPNVKKVFLLTRMDSVFCIYKSLEEALPGSVAKAV